MIRDVRISDGNRQHLIDYINHKKKLGTFRVIDLGGSVSSWSLGIIDALIDINVPKNLPKDMIFYQGNVNEPDVWQSILEDVSKNGKYDFLITSHTLEDISSPAYVCKMISKVSKAGFIAVPSKYRELAIFENYHYKYRGYIHHRWIFNIEGDEIVGYPKIPFLEHAVDYNSIATTNSNVQDLSFYWENNIPLRIINNDYLGPDVESVIGYYRRLLV